MVSVIFVLSIAPYAHAEEDTHTYQWRIKNDPASSWTESPFANIGFTQNTLEFLIHLDRAPYLDEELFLTLSPTYLDAVDIAFVNQNGHKKLTVVGDKEGLYNFKKYETSGIWSIPIPAGTQSIEIGAASTSNLRLFTKVLPASVNQQRVIETTSVRAIIVAVILSTAIISIALWLTFRRQVFFAFSLYQLAWIALLSGIDGTALHFFNISNPAIRDALVSYSVVVAFTLGSYCHATILRKLFNLKWLPYILYLLSGLGFGLLALMGMGYEFLVLKTNAILISLMPIVIAAGSFLETPVTSDLKERWKTTRWIYAALMLTVTATGISGLGAGQLFSMTYLHAFFTTAILAYIILNALSHQRELTAQQFLDDALADASNRMLSAQLSDNRAMLSMLAHEIKTPITTIKLLIHKAKNEKTISKQLNEIQDVLDQVSNLDYYNDKLTQTSSREPVILSDAIEQAWERSGENSNHILMNMRSSDVVINMNQSELNIILRNLFTNVKKYASPESAFRVYTVDRDSYTDLIFSNQTTNFREEDMELVFDKYWRSKEAHSSRGTGVGLWISKKICDKYNFAIKACIHRQRFTMTISIPDRDISYV
jgi:signal transduction histidine kinase